MWKSQTARALLLAVFILVLILAAFLNFHGLYQAFITDQPDQPQISDIKDRASTLQSLVTIVAIVFGGIYAWLKLQLFRDFEPHLTITHEIGHRPVGNTYLHMDVTAILHNSSKVSLNLRKAVFRIQQVSPTTDEEVEKMYADVFQFSLHDDIQWPTLEEVDLDWESGGLVIEPGESHRETYEFIISSDIEVVLAYTFFDNPQASKHAKAADGWGATTICDTLLTDR